MAETRLVQGKRGGSALIHDGYKYQKNKTRMVYLLEMLQKRMQNFVKTNNFVDNGGGIHVITINEHEH